MWTFGHLPDPHLDLAELAKGRGADGGRARHDLVGGIRRVLQRVGEGIKAAGAVLRHALILSADPAGKGSPLGSGHGAPGWRVCRKEAMMPSELGSDVRPQVVSAALAGARTVPFWTDWVFRGRPAPQRRDRLTGGGTKADLVIVGGGFTGLWAAIQAKELDPGRSVMVLEAEHIGFAASGHNGGFVAPSLTHGLAQGVACWPDEVATLERLGEENYRGLAESVAAYGIDAELHEPGELTIALTEHQVPGIREA